MAKKFEQLRASIMTDPVRRARVEEYRRATYDALALAELRESRHVAQQQDVQKLGVSQGRVSRIEHQSDIYLSTVSHYVEAFGGRLEVTAVFPDGSVALVEPESERE